MNEDASLSSGPVRTCIGCRQKRNKEDLIRLVVNRDNEVVFDPERVKPGRGAYLCPTKHCLDQALKRRRFRQAFKRPVETNILEGETIPWEK